MLRSALIAFCCSLGFAAGALPARAQPPEPKPAEPGPTGPLSEAEFKALHDLKDGKAPPPKGRSIDLDGGKAYLSLPPGAKPPLAGIVVIHEWWGLNGHIQHWADRLAASGYAALAVDLYRGTVATTRDDAMAAMRAVDAAAARKTLLAAHEFLAKDPRILATRRASLGWCFGGAQSLELALAAPDLDAAVIYYGRLVTDPDRLKSVKAAVCGVFGTRDRSIPMETVEAFEKGLAAAGVAHEIHRYEADHAFANPSSARYDAPAASAAWEKVQAFLAKRLKR